jgi:hypothetical protein
MVNLPYVALFSDYLNSSTTYESFSCLIEWVANSFFSKSGRFFLIVSTYYFEIVGSHSNNKKLVTQAPPEKINGFETTNLSGLSFP